MKEATLTRVIVADRGMHERPAARKDAAGRGNWLLREYVAHYNEARPHRALALEPPAGTVQLALVSGGRVIVRPVLGGLLYEYEREAA